MAGARHAVVIGGGITGLACAYYLKAAGAQVTVLETSAKPGGILQTVEKNGFLFEAGPQCPRFSPRLWQLIRDVGIAGEFLPADSRAPRYILKDGRLHKAPFSPLAFLTTDLVSLRTKLRLTAEVFRRSHPPDDEESLASLVRRKFGSDLLECIVDPVISAVFAGDPEKMGVGSAFPFLARWEREQGSLFLGAIKSRGAGKLQRSGKRPATQPPSNDAQRLSVTESLPPLGSFRNGVGTLPAALAGRLGDSLRLSTAAQSLERVSGAPNSLPQWRIRLRSGAEIVADAVVIATPAQEASQLFTLAEPDLASTLAAFPYAPITVVSLAFERSQVRAPLRGFGFMVPRRENLNTFYTVWNSSLFPGRAPEGKILITSFAGGARKASFAGQEDETAARVVEGEISPILGTDGPAIERFVWNHPRALPQFNIGHAARVNSVRQSVGRLPGVFLAGNYLDGRSLGDCVEIGFQTAEGAKRLLGL